MYPTDFLSNATMRLKFVLFCVRNIVNIGWIAMKLGTAPLVMNSISFGDLRPFVLCHCEHVFSLLVIK